MKEQEAIARSRAKRIDAFLDCLKACPHVIPADIGAEAFVAEIDKGSIALAKIFIQNTE
jgi:hypothetical protein